MKILLLLLSFAIAEFIRRTDAAFVTPLKSSCLTKNRHGVDGIFRSQHFTRRHPVTIINGRGTSLDATSSSSSEEFSSLDIVFFGVGDLRVDDHVGLNRAIEASAASGNNVVLPLFVLNDDMIFELPGAVAHTVDTCNLLAASLKDLDASLRERNLSLMTVVGTPGPVAKILNDVILQAKNVNAVRVHVCDLGEADNRMGYGALGQLLRDATSNIDYEIVTWSNALRDEPWREVSDFDDYYPSYEAKYVVGVASKEPVTLATSVRSDQVLSTNASNGVPSAESLLNRFTRVLDIDRVRCQAEVGTGIYATHWGGLPAESIGCRTVQKIIQSYVTDCNADDKVWSMHPSHPVRSCTRNERSLEHASMAWQLAGDGRSPAGNSDNWMAGESMIRFVAAPLFYGTLSSRRLAKIARTDGYVLFESPLRKLVEGQEWHRLLAARNILSDTAYQNEGKTVYRYWRYHGFLCRYAETDFDSIPTSSDEREGILLVHGFGASGTQWNKAMHELSRLQTKAAQGLAPDLIGFGQSEKPAISYTGYMWDSQVMVFCKEVAAHKNQWTSFVTGGNSIGGYTSMSLAACDTAMGKELSSSGAPGTGRCTGLVLMNSAGPVKTKEEIEQEQASANDWQMRSVAQATAMQALPVCKPPPRLVARVFGNALLVYLRPRIQSICRNLYPANPTAVDDELCKSIERDSLDPGAINVMMAGAKLPPPRTANELLGADFGMPCTGEGQVRESIFDGPVLIAQGILDPLNDSTDRMNRFRALREGIEVDPIQAGHCPHDELPDHVAKSIAFWMSARTPDMSRFSTKAAASFKSH